MEAEPLCAPRAYPAANLVFARNNRASTASFVAKFGISRQDWTAFSTNDLELYAEREGNIQRQKLPRFKRSGVDNETKRNKR